MLRKNILSPFTSPIFFFGGVILIGAALLHQPASLVPGGRLAWIDAVFTATSATCVTGLAVVDTGTQFSRFGQVVILALIQLGGLGIMTYSSLVFYLWRRRVSLSDRVAVGQSLLHDPNFQIGRFLVHLVLWTVVIEGWGAASLYILDPLGFKPFSAVFHAVSAFCNAGFGLHADSLVAWRANFGVNLVVMALIVLGGLGFSLLVELELMASSRLFLRLTTRSRPRLSWYARVVLKMTAALILGGAAVIFLAENIGYRSGLPFGEACLAAFFQSVTCRTAGFNTLDIGSMTNVSLLFMIFLMFIGGSPGSCAGGIKTTTFRALLAFAGSHFRGRQQAVIGRYALDHSTQNKALTLVIFAIIIVCAATLILAVTEGGDVPHPLARGQLIEVLFEVVSAFGTVGLSMGLTSKLTLAGKIVVTALMFIGRLGPVLFVSAIQNFQDQPHYKWPEESLLIG